MRRLDAAHPVFAGHFPGNPLVPGAYLLAIVIEEASARACAQGLGCRPVGVRTVKFLQPVRPQQPFRCEFQPVDEQAWRFQIMGEAGRIAAGTLRMATSPDGQRPDANDAGDSDDGPRR